MQKNTGMQQGECVDLRRFARIADAHVGVVSAVGVRERGVVGGHVVSRGGNSRGVGHGEGGEVADVLQKEPVVSVIVALKTSSSYLTLRDLAPYRPNTELDLPTY